MRTMLLNQIRVDWKRGRKGRDEKRAKKEEKSEKKRKRVEIRKRAAERSIEKAKEFLISFL